MEILFSQRFKGTDTLIFVEGLLIKTDMEELSGTVLWLGFWRQIMQFKNLKLMQVVGLTYRYWTYVH